MHSNDNFGNEPCICIHNAGGPAAVPWKRRRGERRKIPAVTHPKADWGAGLGPYPKSCAMQALINCNVVFVAIHRHVFVVQADNVGMLVAATGAAAL